MFMCNVYVNTYAYIYIYVIDAFICMFISTQRCIYKFLKLYNVFICEYSIYIYVKYLGLLVITCNYIYLIKKIKNKRVILQFILIPKTTFYLQANIGRVFKKRQVRLLLPSQFGNRLQGTWMQLYFFIFQQFIHHILT